MRMYELNAIFETPWLFMEKIHTGNKPSNSNKNKQSVYDVIKELRICSALDVSDKLTINKSTVNLCIAELKDEGRIKIHDTIKHDRTKTRIWKVT